MSQVLNTLVQITSPHSFYFHYLYFSPAKYARFIQILQTQVREYETKLKFNISVRYFIQKEKINKRQKLTRKMLIEVGT